MDNKITKDRFKRHLEYDWYRYVLVILASVFVWYVVFMELNASREYEKLEVFFGCYSSNEDLDAPFLNSLAAEGDDLVREVEVAYRSPLESYYGQLFMAAVYSADIFVVSDRDMRVYAGWFLELTDEVISACLPDEIKDSIGYYVYSKDSVSEEGYDPSLEGRKCAFRVDDLAKIDVDNPPFVFDLKRVNPDLSDEDVEGVPTTFYLGISRESNNIGKFCKKEKYRGYDQTFRFVRFFMERYAI